MWQIRSTPAISLAATNILSLWLIGYLTVAKKKWTSTAIVTQPDVGQIAGYTNAMNVIYRSAVPKLSDIQASLIGRH